MTANGSTCRTLCILMIALSFSSALGILTEFDQSSIPLVEGRQSESSLVLADHQALVALFTSVHSSLLESECGVSRTNADISIGSICTKSHKCSHRIECSVHDGEFRVQKLDLSGLDLEGNFPDVWLDQRDFHSTHKDQALPMLSLLDFSANDRLLFREDDSCVSLPICTSATMVTCLPEGRFCTSPESLTTIITAPRSLQTTVPTLTDPNELAAWQSFYDSTGGSKWRSCGGAAARANPCDPTICATGGVVRYVLCDTKNGKTTLQVIRFEDNFLRGILDGSVISQMANLNMFWIVNSAQANLTTANVVFTQADCLSLQRCYTGTSCKFDGTGLVLCPQITTAPTMSPTTPPPTLQPTTGSPTRLPTTAAPTSKSPTTAAPTLQPTSKSPTSRSPTTSSPSQVPTVSPTKSTLAPTTLRPTLPPTPPKTNSPTKETPSPTKLPTRYPTMQPTTAALSTADATAWQQIYDALRGSFWDFCDQSQLDPCNELTNGCAYHTFVRCNTVADGTYRITDIFLEDNSLFGIIPESAFQVLGPNLALLDLSSQMGGNRLGMQGACLDFQFCYNQGTRCYFDGSGPILCPQHAVTASPTVYPILSATEQSAWNQLYTDLFGNSWRGGCGGEAVRVNPCMFPSCVTCVVASGAMHISGFLLKNRGLEGYLDDRVFWYFPFLTYIDFSDNKGVTSTDTVGIFADDCIRAETCFNQGSFCNFNRSGVELCQTSLFTAAPALGPVALAFPDEVAFNWIFTDLHGPTWSLPSSCQSISLGDDPCFGCPNRVRCVVNPANPSELIISEILLNKTNVSGIIPLLPLNHLFSRGLRRLIMTNNRLVLDENSGGCLNLVPCYNGNATCDFTNSGIGLCDPPLGMPPTNAPTTPTKSPTMTAARPCRTSGGLVAEGTPCAVPFTYASIPFSSCISFTSRPPLSQVPYALPRVPTDFWCSTASTYNLDTQNSWGFCDCTDTGVDIVTPAPFVTFTLTPTKLPTTSPPTFTPTKLPSTMSPTRVGATLIPTKQPTTAQPSKTPTTSTPSRKPTNQPSTKAPTARPTTSVPSKKPTSLPTVKPTVAPTRNPASPPTSHTPSNTPTKATKSPTSLAPSKSPTGKTSSPSKLPTPLPTIPGTGRPSRTPTTSLPSNTPTAKPSKNPTLTPSKVPSVTPTTSFPSQVPSRAPTPPTNAPVFLVSDSELGTWRQFYDALGGRNWLACAQTRNNPCSCKASSTLFVKCSTTSGGGGGGAGGRRRRRLQGGDGNTHITEINLPSNGLIGVVNVSTLEQFPDLSSLNLEGNAVALPPGSDCSDLTICSKTCKIGSTCDSTATYAPTSAPGGTDVGAIVAIVIILLILLVVLVIFFTHRQCPDRLPSKLKQCLDSCGSSKMAKGFAASTSKKQKDSGEGSNGLDKALMVAEPADDEEEYADPAFSKMAKHATETRLPTKDEQRPDGRSHFSLMSGESLPQLKDNSSLSDAKLDALKLDEAARKDVPDMDGLLENIGLGHKAQAFKDAGVRDIIALMRLNDQRMREIGLNLGERVKLKRTIDIRKGLQNDPVFGKPT